MAGIKTCSICGKEFESKGRERTCPGPHYLPCPVCGKPVEIQYASYGPKNCEDCKGKRAKKSENGAILIQPASSAESIQKPTAFQSLVLTATQEAVVKETTEPQVDEFEEIPEVHLPEGPKKQEAFELPKEEDNPTIVVDMGEDTSVMTYVGPFINHHMFLPNHKYQLEFSKESKYGCYVVTSVYDYTADEKVDIYMRISSMKTMNRYFSKVAV